MKQVLRPLKPFAFPFIRSAFPRIQRARRNSRFLLATFDPTARTVTRTGPFFLVGLGWIWSDLVLSTLIPLVRLGRLHWPRPAPAASFCLLPFAFCLPAR